MFRRKIVITLMIGALALTACAAIRRATGGGAGGAGFQLTRTAEAAGQPTHTPAATQEPQPQATATESVPNTPVPTVDFRGYLLTQAYSLYTPRPSTTPSPGPTATNTQGPTPIGGFVNPTAVPTTAPLTSVYFSEPVTITNAVTEALCEIRNIGDCIPQMPKGSSTYYTFTFGVAGGVDFQWGIAAVAIDKDGQSFRWFEADNGLKPPPEEDEMPKILNGESAEFRAGLDNLQPGNYTVRLMMCQLTPAECLAGGGWQAVGGQSIQFTITP
jgi:hypothetical protein